MANTRSGVKVGYRAWWRYNPAIWKEYKTKKGEWKISLRSPKQRKAKGFGSHPIGRRIRWKINATQDVVKVGKGRYLTHMYGKKKLNKVGFKKL